MNIHSVPVHTTYDGMADFPSYPIHVISDINASAGHEAAQDVDTVHAVAPNANVVEFQNAHTQTGSRIDTHA
ncbi:MAG TPA: PE-PPE domain-containing protein [Candidatus Acidoferrum sp.]|nr:PE-PPE domain-containing protein [Candidatus Acidoferrum sp.]